MPYNCIEPLYIEFSKLFSKEIIEYLFNPHSYIIGSESRLLKIICDKLINTQEKLRKFILEYKSKNNIFDSFNELKNFTRETKLKSDQEDKEISNTNNTSIYYTTIICDQNSEICKLNNTIKFLTLQV